MVRLPISIRTYRKVLCNFKLDGAVRKMELDLLIYKCPRKNSQKRNKVALNSVQASSLARNQAMKHRTKLINLFISSFSLRILVNKSQLFYPRDTAATSISGLKLLTWQPIGAKIFLQKFWEKLHFLVPLGPKRY